MVKATQMDWACPTCGGGPRPFRHLKPNEEAFLASKGVSPADIHATWRCATTGCLSMRQHLKPWQGQRLPADIDD
ncbi:hypothetical protein ACIREE_31765 [Streptomyces sp. NPDC102467]|uniref:hypothetical protein n=1 Tax=Streptomyces sp. NPDC102467 TaxID=3366179 RepID=UPI00383050FF